MLDFLPPVLQYPVSFVAVLTVVVFVHELGHYLIGEVLEQPLVRLGMRTNLIGWVQAKSSIRALDANESI